jgi:NADPH:quinone reductase-like Zn-dependent oxidoreductase
VLQLKEVEKPAPKEDEVLVRVCASSINSRDWRLMRASPFFIRFSSFFKPKIPILGADAAGRIEAVGTKVSQFQPGDEVFGYVSTDDRGTFAEYACFREEELALKPANVSFEQAGAVPVAAITALQGLRNKGNIQAGQKVLIQGASGGVGTYAVQLAKAFGAEVTGVCSTRNLEMTRSIGADHVIDYTQDDFTMSGELYDLILAVNGYHPIKDYLRVLNPEGSYVVAGGAMRQIFDAGAKRGQVSESAGQKIYLLSLVHDQQDLVLLKEMLESVKIAPVIDGSYPLSRTREAMRYYEEVHPRGNVVITMGEEG